MCSRTLIALFCITLLSHGISALHLDHRDLDAAFLPCYDYIVVGGGVAGLVVANRLTEDPNVNVLLLEAGILDDYGPTVMIPEDVGDDLGGEYDWNLFTENQTYLDGLARGYDMGKVLGGSSILNGMCWTRGNAKDYDAWVTLGNPGWGWSDLLPYFEKTETYTDDVGAEFSSELYIHPDRATHGSTGYVPVTYPNYFYNQSSNFLEGMKELGIPILDDPNSGIAGGAALIPNNISPTNESRADVRVTYYDPFISRPNFHVASSQTVTRILISNVGGNAEADSAQSDSSNGAGAALPSDAPRPDMFGNGSTIQGNTTSAGLKRGLPNLRITGVEFASNDSSPRRNVSCSREVILAAGAVHTPQLLQLSGIGQADLLQKYDIPLAIDLPGVGYNFQDHPMVGAVYSYNNHTYFMSSNLSDSDQASKAYTEYYTNRTGPWTAGAINTVAFPPLGLITNNTDEILNNATEQAPGAYLEPDLDESIKKGYALQKQLLIDLLGDNTVGAYEILNTNFGQLSVSAMHTFSRGHVLIKSASPFTGPMIDPRYCSNPIDCEILLEALLFNNRLIETPSMKVLQPEPIEALAGTNRTAIMEYINLMIRTEFHGTGTASMLPLDMGGVVDSSLMVYGTSNLRVVDASIMPLVPSAHIQAGVYAVAEKAADIIKAAMSNDTTRLGCSIDSASPGTNSSASSSSATVAAASSSAVSSSSVLSSSSSVSSLSVLSSSLASSSSSVPSSSSASSSSSLLSSSSGPPSSSTLLSSSTPPSSLSPTSLSTFSSSPAPSSSTPSSASLATSSSFLLSFTTSVASEQSPSTPLSTQIPSSSPATPSLRIAASSKPQFDRVTSSTLTLTSSEIVTSTYTLTVYDPPLPTDPVDPVDPNELDACPR